MSISSLVRSRILVAALVLGAATLLAAACSSSSGGGTTPTGGGQTPAAGETPSGGGQTAEISMIPSIQFDKTELTIAGDTDVTITADNTDSGITHNFAVYTSKDAADSGEDALAATGTCTAPCTDTVTVNLTPGEYYFRCQVHPSQMTGTLIVQ
jgi:plastocyanin